MAGTLRGGRYTPITSIDFMRSRAADTGEYAGNDDAIFTGEPSGANFQATLTVYRIVQGMRCPFTATARWKEYYVETSPMWKKMPYTMLSKCAEALALRKGFPQQLSGLYTSEEMDQAGTQGEIVEVHRAAPMKQLDAIVVTVPEREAPPVSENQEPIDWHKEISILWAKLRAFGIADFKDAPSMLAHFKITALKKKWAEKDQAVEKITDLSTLTARAYAGILTDLLEASKQ